MKKRDLDYYRRRLADEQGAIARAAGPEAATPHRALAEHYAILLDRADEEEEEE